MRRLVTVVIALVALAAFAVAATTSASGAGSTTVKTARAGKLGRILVNGKGVTLYLFEKDTKNKSKCSGPCAVNWPPLIKHGTIRALGGVKASKLGTTRRADGSRQVTYAGHPLYTFVLDRNRPGSTKGQKVDAFGAEWYVVGTNGKSVE